MQLGVPSPDSGGWPQIIVHTPTCNRIGVAPSLSMHDFACPQTGYAALLPPLAPSTTAGLQCSVLAAAAVGHAAVRRGIRESALPKTRQHCLHTVGISLAIQKQVAPWHHPVLTLDLRGVPSSTSRSILFRPPIMNLLQGASVDMTHKSSPEQCQKAE